MTRTVAVTGGTGFLGAAVISALTARGDRVKALARAPGKLPQADNVMAIAGALDDRTALARLAAGTSAIVHCAGLTHARRDDEFDEVNVKGARAAAEAAAQNGSLFIHISSIAARRPDLSPYSASKRRSEDAIAQGSGANPWIVLRAPAMYGPGDAATLPYFRLVKLGLAPEPAMRPAPRASLVYVADAANAILAAIEAPARRVYEFGDDVPEGRSWREIGAALAAAMGKKAARLPAPRFILGPCAQIGAQIARVSGAAPMLTPGKIAEFFHPDWVARDNLLSGATAWRPRTPLKEGFAKTVRWYQEHGLL
ncbi:MAG: NAD-dependent epimerase/dehydratase family protein [Amphiplicatus sp.]